MYVCYIHGTTVRFAAGRTDLRITQLVSQGQYSALFAVLTWKRGLRVALVNHISNTRPSSTRERFFSWQCISNNSTSSETINR